MTLVEENAVRYSPYKVTVGGGLHRVEQNRRPRNIFEYRSASGTLWVINTSSHVSQWINEQAASPKEVLETVSLISRYEFGISNKPQQATHDENLIFLRENWSSIRDAIRPSKKDHKIRPYTFIEVDFDTYGRADFIGFASDGSLVIIEVGVKQKPSQVGMHALGLSRITGNTPIFPYVAQYSNHASIKTLTVDLAYCHTSKSKLPPPSSWK